LKADATTCLQLAEINYPHRKPKNIDVDDINSKIKFYNAANFGKNCIFNEDKWKIVLEESTPNL
jgi:hypothetical protein